MRAEQVLFRRDLERICVVHATMAQPWAQMELVSETFRELRLCEDVEYVDPDELVATPAMYDIPDFWHPPLGERIELTDAELLATSRGELPPRNYVAYQVDPMFLGLVQYTQVFNVPVGRGVVHLPATPEDDHVFRVKLDAVLERHQGHWEHALPDAPYRFQLDLLQLDLLPYREESWGTLFSAERRLLRLYGAMVRAVRTGKCLVTPRVAGYLHPNLLDALVREGVETKGFRWVFDDLRGKPWKRPGVSYLDLNCR